LLVSPSYDFCFALKNEVANKFCDENDIEYRLVFKKNLDKL